VFADVQKQMEEVEVSVDVQEMMEEAEEVFADVDVQERTKMEEEVFAVVDVQERLEMEEKAVEIDFALDSQMMAEEQMEYLGLIQLQAVDPVGDQAVAEAATLLEEPDLVIFLETDHWSWSWRCPCWRTSHLCLDTVLANVDCLLLLWSCHHWNCFLVESCTSCRLDFLFIV